MTKKKTLQEVVTTGKFTFPIAVLFVALLWFIGTFSLIHEADGTTFWLRLLNILQGPFWQNITACVLILVGMLLMQLLYNTFALIRVHTQFFLTLYVLFVGLLVPQNLNEGSVLLPCMMLALFCLMHTYQLTHPVGYAFQSFLFIGLGSLLFPPFLYYIPILYVGLSSFRALTWRTFFAGLMGVLLPYWLLFAYAVFTHDMQLFYEPLLQLIPELPPSLGDWTLAYSLPLCYFAFISLAGSLHCMVNNYADKVQTRVYLSYLVTLQVWTLLLILAQPQHFAILFPLFLGGSSFPVAHLFTLHYSKGSNLFFIFCVILFIALFLFEVWIHSQHIY